MQTYAVTGYFNISYPLYVWFSFMEDSCGRQFLFFPALLFVASDIDKIFIY
jgi:hypothetical protein